MAPASLFFRLGTWLLAPARRAVFRVSSCKSGFSHAVYEYGSGQPVIILHELPGLSVADLNFGLRLACREAFKVYLPLLFGEFGQRNSLIGSLQACFSGSFSCFSASKSSRITESLRALCNAVSECNGGAAIGVVGLCLTGTLPLALLTERCVQAVVCCEPSLPLVGHSADLGLSLKELQAAKSRSDVPILAYRFSNDRISPHARFAEMCYQFGSRFQGKELASSHATNSHSDHAVMTESYSDSEGSSTRMAFDEMLKYLKRQLG